MNVYLFYKEMNYKARMTAENLEKHNSRRRRDAVVPKIVHPSTVLPLSIDTSSKYGGIVFCFRDRTPMTVTFRLATSANHQCGFEVSNKTTDEIISKIGKN